ncbi:ABC transporter permease [Blastopirellula marina]|uniref:Probable ABC transport system integral membrane protein n=1 Tax=Blastopirellula marina DSM 3645 TaxID=314230 RepID=A3ZPB7_9BACT|nr:FtsX family ABC transporter permease [Blastopirellula marina]EAQ81595.1 probable ABC transport system integral membrane protein [Blastopirellula marina DSM 3645]
MSKVAKLAIAFLREHPTRVVLTSLATTAAACMVIWLASGYDALLQSFDQWATVALGHYELSIAPISTTELTAVPQEVVKAMRADSSVAVADPMWLKRTVVRGNAKPFDPTAPRNEIKQGRLEEGPPNVRSEYSVLSSSTANPPFDVEGEWLDADQSDALEVVVRSDTAQRLEVTTGDFITVSYNDKTWKLQVIGLLKAPSLGAGAYAVPNMLTPSAGDIFIATQLGEKIFGQPAQISFLGLAMAPDADVNQFRFSWAPKLSRFDVPVQFQEAYEIEEALDESAAADNLRMQSYAGTGISLLVAMLVIFCTLNMGVTERVRQFAILRAVALTRRQVCLLIFAEGLLLATIGFLGGLLISWLMLSGVSLAVPGILRHGATIGASSLTLAAVATYGGAILAAAIPAWRATRVRPVDAMAPTAQSAPMGLPTPLILFGVALIPVNPIITFIFPPTAETQVLSYFGIGSVSMAIGFVMIAPTVVFLVDRLMGPILARVLGIDAKLLESQITSQLWRTTAASISLAVGMGLFISVQVWGFTMLDGFLVGPWAPDAVLAFPKGGLPLEDVRKIAQIQGVNPQQCLPIVVEQPRFVEDLTGSAERPSVIRQDNLVIVGIDPDAAFDGSNPLFDLEWVAGTPQEAVRQMRAGRACIVPDHFLAESGLHVGDNFDLAPPEDAGGSVRYVIAGAVRLPGWHWQTKLTGFRSRTHRAAALAFANYDVVAEDFDFSTATHVWLNFASTDVNPDQIAEAAERILAVDRPPIAATSEVGDGVKIMPVEKIRQMTRNNAARWIWAVSQLPIAAVAIAGFGVLNVILASVRARQWEMGVLRSIGISRSAILRAIVAEGAMIGIAASLLSVSFGVMAGWCGCGIAQYVSFFGGLHPALNIPWPAVSLGLLYVMALSTLSAVWPALSISRLSPLTLLQRGRAAI